MESAEGDWKGLVILAASTGLRLIDAARLTWGKVDGGVLRLRTQKRGVIFLRKRGLGFLALVEVSGWRMNTEVFE